MSDRPTHPECLTCGEIEGVEGECPKSTRPCGHHCNHVWTHDLCHWCGAEISDDGDLIPTAVPSSWEPQHA